MFDSTKEDLKDTLRKCAEGKLQLPNFQRDYVWGDDDVRSLIASIAKGFPVGALLTLETGSEVAFQPRLLEGVAPKAVEPDELLLDVQQRITSLFQSTYSKQPVRTKIRKNTEVDRYYYLDIVRNNRRLASGSRAGYAHHPQQQGRSRTPCVTSGRGFGSVTHGVRDLRGKQQAANTRKCTQIVSIRVHS